MRGGPRDESGSDGDFFLDSPASRNGVGNGSGNGAGLRNRYPGGAKPISPAGRL